MVIRFVPLCCTSTIVLLCYLLPFVCRLHADTPRQRNASAINTNRRQQYFLRLRLLISLPFDLFTAATEHSAAPPFIRKQIKTIISSLDQDVVSFIDIYVAAKWVDVNVIYNWKCFCFIENLYMKTRTKVYRIC